MANGKDNKTEEMSMDEVLASIRKIISSDDETEEFSASPKSSLEAEDDLIELTEEVSDSETRAADSSEINSANSEAIHDASANGIKDATFDASKSKEERDSAAPSPLSALAEQAKQEESSEADTQEIDDFLNELDSKADNKFMRPPAGALNKEHSTKTAENFSSQKGSTQNLETTKKDFSSNEEEISGEEITALLNKGHSALNSKKAGENTLSTKTSAEEHTSFLSHKVAETARSQIEKLRESIAPQPIETNFKGHEDQSTAKALEELVLKALHPVLKDWLDQHLSTIVERVVKEEIQKIVKP